MHIILNKTWACPQRNHSLVGRVVIKFNRRYVPVRQVRKGKRSADLIIWMYWKKGFMGMTKLGLKGWGIYQAGLKKKIRQNMTCSVVGRADTAQCGWRKAGNSGWWKHKLCISWVMAKQKDRQADALILEVLRAMLRRVNFATEEF